VIEHVPSGEKRYFRSLGEIGPFVATYLVQMGIKIGPLQRLRLWWLDRARAKAMKASRRV